MFPSPLHIEHETLSDYRQENNRAFRWYPFQDTSQGLQECQVLSTAGSDNPHSLRPICDTRSQHAKAPTSACYLQKLQLTPKPPGLTGLLLHVVGLSCAQLSHQMLTELLFQVWLLKGADMRYCFYVYYF